MTLFENEFCKITEDTSEVWTRYDKILGTSMEVESYFDGDNLIKKVLNCNHCENELDDAQKFNSSCNNCGKKPL
jgi:hypothetical protein|tara:strand:- start:5258 stop:5479 length:222 start_codon:yes stop_codon:yes gene_type:complete